jgi:hypothetical protein
MYIKTVKCNLSCRIYNIPTDDSKKPATPQGLNGIAIYRLRSPVSGEMVLIYSIRITQLFDIKIRINAINLAAFA